MTNAIQVHGVRKNHAFNLHVKAFLKRNQETNSLLHHIYYALSKEEQIYN